MAGFLVRFTAVFFFYLAFFSADLFTAFLSLPFLSLYSRYSDDIVVFLSVLYLYTFEHSSIYHVKGFTVANEHLYTSVFCVNCGHTVPIPVYCKNRFCSVCSRHRNRLIRWKLEEFLRGSVLRKYDSFKFLTLTIRNNPDLQAMTTELMLSFRKLRNRSVWKKHVRGGACIIEVKTGEGGWHVHLHIVIESGFIPFATLLSEWKAVSSGQGVYIRKLHDSQVVSYLTKYLTKEQATEAEQKDMTAILKGRRLLLVFGSWHAPISTMKRLQFCCPDCNGSYWGFGNRNHWFDVNTHNWAVDRRLSEGLPSIKQPTQGCLLPDSYLMTGCQQ